MGYRHAAAPSREATTWARTSTRSPVTATAPGQTPAKLYPLTAAPTPPRPKPVPAEPVDHVIHHVGYDRWTMKRCAVLASMIGVNNQPQWARQYGGGAGGGGVGGVRRIGGVLGAGAERHRDARPDLGDVDVVLGVHRR